MQMRIEQKVSGGKGKVSSESRNNKRKQKKLSPVQRLYETCKEVFADCGPYVVPSPDKVEKLVAVLDGMTPADVGLRPNIPIFSRERAPTITYLRIHECDKFSIGIFCLPPTSVIPLHNHPGMTVFSKLLFGTMHIKAFDWSNAVDKNTDLVTPNSMDATIRPDGLRLANMKVNSEFIAPCRTFILYPADGGNLHRFTAKTACAVLDVLGPPYRDRDGRHCQYYSEFPFSKFPVANICIGDEDEVDEGYAWLMERDKPEELSVVALFYDGPKIVKK